jgi:hypothetical protein
MRVPVALTALLLAWPTLAQQPTPIASQDDNRNKPDPTVLTTQAQEKATIALRELIDTKIKAIQDEIDRLKAGGDYTDQRLLKRIDEVPALIDTSLTHLQKLVEEKFKGVDQQFAGRDVALAAALLAQKTSVDEQNKANAASSAKQEGAITKQIEGIQAYNTANSKGTDDKIESLKTLLASQAKSSDDKVNDIRKTVDDLRVALTTNLADLRSTAAAASARGEGQSQVWIYLIAGGSLLIAFAGVVLPRLHTQPPQYAQYPPQPSGYAQPQVSVLPAVVPVTVPPAQR